MNKDKIKLMELWNEVASGFGKAGPTYWNDFGATLVEFANIGIGASVLEIGVGRGASFIPALKQIGNHGSLTGIDLSSEMLNHLNKEISSMEVSNTTLIQMDASNLEFEDESFDNIIAGFSLWHALDDNNMLTQLKNKMKTNGQLTFSTWGHQVDQEPLAIIAREYLPKPKINKQPKKELVESKRPLVLNTVEGINDFLIDLEFNDIKVIEEIKQVYYKNTTEWWNDMWNNAARGVFQHIKAQGDDIYQEYQSRINLILQDLKVDEGICFNMKVIYASAKK